MRTECLVGGFSCLTIPDDSSSRVPSNAHEDSSLHDYFPLEGLVNRVLSFPTLVSQDKARRSVDRDSSRTTHVWVTVHETLLVLLNTYHKLENPLSDYGPSPTCL